MGRAAKLGSPPAAPRSQPLPSDVPEAPRLLIVAGPNGSGKSTLTAQLRADGIELGVYINPDEIAATLSGAMDQRSAEAQVIAEERRRACLDARVSFTFETVMSHASKVRFLAQAREAGYRVIMYFVALEDPDLNVARVRQRVALGGHDVPEDRVRDRYERVMALLPEAMAECHRVVLFDNTYRAVAGGPAMLTPCVEMRRTGHTPRYFGPNGQRLENADISEMPNWVLAVLPRSAFRSRKLTKFIPYPRSGSLHAKLEREMAERKLKRERSTSNRKPPKGS